MIPQLIGAGVGALIPLIAEISRTKPDPEVAKQAIMAKRQEMIDRAIGTGAVSSVAEKQVDDQITRDLIAADEAGEFNMPLGEMISMGLLGALAPAAFGAAKKGATAVMGSLKGGKNAAAVAPNAAAGAPAAVGPSAADISLAQAGGMPLSKGKSVVPPKGTESPDVGEMMAGPFPGAQAEMPLTMGKAVKPPKRDNVDIASMLAGGPFPG